MLSEATQRTSPQFRSLIDELRLPIVAAPMTAVSGPELVAAACLAGVVGSFPAHNASSHEELDAWLDNINGQIASARQAGGHPGPIALNLVMRAKSRLRGDVAAAIKHDVPIVIASVGSPAEIIPPLHEAGILVFADVASLRHADKSLAAGVDGLVLLASGAGGNTGWVNPFAFVRAVRSMYDGPLVLAGGVSDGIALRAAITLGCNLAFVGTRFIATHESRADNEYKQALLNATLDHVVARLGPEGLTANMLGDSNYTAGHSVSGIDAIISVADLVDELASQYTLADALSSAAVR